MISVKLNANNVEMFGVRGKLYFSVLHIGKNKNEKRRDERHRF